MNSKKAMGALYPFIFVSLMVIFAVLFFIMFFWEVFKEYLVTPLNDEIQNSLGGMMTVTSSNFIQETSNYVLSFDFGFDLIFFALFTFMLVKVFKYAISQPAISKTWFGFFLFGNMLVSGFVIFYLEEMLVWFVTNYIINFIGVDLSFLNYVVNNLGWLIFLIINGALVTNQLKEFISEEVFRQ